MFVILISSCGISAMEQEQKLSMIERKATACALSQLSFLDNEKILHIGPRREEIIKKKAVGAQVYCIDTDTLSMLQNSIQGYDKILSFVCWDVAKDPQESFNNSARLLKNSGQFCAVIPYHKSPYLNIHYQTLTNDKWKNFYNKGIEVDIYGSKKMKEFLIKAGLGANVACVVIKKPFIFKTRELFAGWIQSCPEQLDGIDLEHRAAFVNDVVNNYLQQYPLEQDDSVQLYLPYMIVSGYKS